MRLFILIWLVIVLLIPFNAKGQSKRIERHLREAYQYYQAQQYLPAAEIYQAVLKNNENHPEATFYLAECLRKTYTYAEAEKYYDLTVGNYLKAYPEALFYLALMQKMNEKYQDAIANFEEFEQLHQQNPTLSELVLQSKVEKKGCFLAQEKDQKQQKNINITLFQPPINSPFNEYAASFGAGQQKIVLSSGRPGKDRKVDPRLGEALSNNFLFIFENNSWISDPSPTFELVNSKFGDGAGVFSHDFTRFYFTSCQETDGNCAIYLSRFDQDKWQQPIKLNQQINSPGYDNKQPNLNASGDTLFFVSNRPGGKGKNDIWYSISQGGDHWSTPQNLTRVNTPFNEISPFYHAPEKTLFFASEGHHGYGGMDIFLAVDPFQKEEIVNIGKPYNSHYDDCFFSLAGKQGLLASNRSNGLGKFDIYQFSQTEDQPAVAYFGDQKPLAGRTTAADGSREFRYFSYFNSQQEGLLADKQQDNKENYGISGKVVDQTGQPVADVTVPLLDDHGDVIKETRTNKDGVFRYEEVNQNSQVKILTGDDQNDNDLVMKEYQQKQKTYASALRTENIYFDFDSYQLRQEARLALDDLVDFYAYFPDIQIEIDAHTDNLGSDYYNKSLSESRARKVYKYLVNKGIDPTALVINAQGKSDPFASNQGELGRQLNRRVEFTLKGLSSSITYPTSTYIIKPNSNLYRISLCFGMTVQDLKLLNGIYSNNVEAYRPIRVYDKKAPDPKYVFIPSQHALKKAETTALLEK